MEEEEKKIIVFPYRRVKDVKNTVWVILILVVGILFLAGVIAFWDVAMLVFALLCFLGAGVMAFYDYKFARRKEEDIYTPDYFLKITDGKEGVKLYWDMIEFIEVNDSSSVWGWTYNSKPKIVFNYFTFVDKEVGCSKQLVTYCTVDELRRIQALIPVKIGEGEYLTAERKAELKALEKREKEYEKDPFYYVSIRGRVAYLLCCLENAFQTFGSDEVEKNRSLLEKLWQYTACMSDVENAEKRKEALEEYKASHEPFPDFIPNGDLKGLVTMEEWAKNVQPLIPAPPAEDDTSRQALIDRIVNAVYKAATHNIISTDFGYYSFHCHATLEVLDEINELLRVNNIPLPEFTYFHRQVYSLYSENTHDPAFGFGLPFNGMGTYSLLSAGKDAADLFAREEESSPYEIYDFLDEVLAPTLKEEYFSKEIKYREKLPVLFFVVLVLGVLFFAASAVLYCLHALYFVPGCLLLSIGFGAVGNLFLGLIAWLCHAMVKYVPSKPKWLYVVCWALISGINIALSWYAFKRAEKNIVPEIYAVLLFCVAGVWFFIETFVTGCTPKVKPFKSYAKLSYDEKTEEPQKPKPIAFIVCGLVLKALSAVIYILYALAKLKTEFSFFSLLSGVTAYVLLCIALKKYLKRGMTLRERVYCSIGAVALLAMYIGLCVYTVFLLPTYSATWDIVFFTLVAIQFLFGAIFSLVVLCKTVFYKPRKSKDEE